MRNFFQKREVRIVFALSAVVNSAQNMPTSKRKCNVM